MPFAYLQARKKNLSPPTQVGRETLIQPRIIILVQADGVFPQYARYENPR